MANLLTLRDYGGMAAKQPIIPCKWAFRNKLVGKLGSHYDIENHAALTSINIWIMVENPFEK